MKDTSARTVVLKPGDVLLIGNIGVSSEDALDALHDGLLSLRHALALSSVAVFEEDINTAALAPLAPMPDAIVLRVFDRTTVPQHRAVLTAWLSANHIDPSTVASDWLSIEQEAGQRFIRYETFRLNDAGGKLIDPRDRDKAWTIERVSPLVIDLDLPAGQTVTDRDEIHDHPGG
ncbi:hypothetical protein [Streptomyces sp. NPDC057253]|uniref:hypothetical protein n=1 Tax=Streptomyces sp. NPDC057253 TaxID=3346069 RepID=UPI0036367A9E